MKLYAMRDHFKQTLKAVQGSSSKVILPRPDLEDLVGSLYDRQSS